MEVITIPWKTNTVPSILEHDRMHEVIVNRRLFWVDSEERKIYKDVVGKLDGFFKVRRNVIFERARFNRRNQVEGKSVEQYITALYSFTYD